MRFNLTASAGLMAAKIGTVVPQGVLAALVPALTESAIRGVRPNAHERARLRVAVDQAISDADSLRERPALAMAPVEPYACFDRARAVELWDIATRQRRPRT